MILSGGKCLTKSGNGFLPDGVLHVEIMLGHIQVDMAYNALNRRKIHAQRLHLANVSMAAAVGR